MSFSTISNALNDCVSCTKTHQNKVKSVLVSLAIGFVAITIIAALAQLASSHSINAPGYIGALTAGIGLLTLSVLLIYIPKKLAAYKKEKALYKKGLAESVTKGNLKVVKKLIADGEDINKRISLNKTPLMLAVYNRQFDMCKLLIQQGARVNALPETESPLHIAASFGDLKICQLLIQKNATINAREQMGQTPLHLAASKNHLAVCELLLKNKANIEAQDVAIQTPLFLAVRYDATEVIKLLEEKGANKEAKDYTGKTAYQYKKQI